MIIIKCTNPQCGHPWTIEARLAGKRLRCRACGTILSVPAAGATGSAPVHAAPIDPSPQSPVEDQLLEIEEESPPNEPVPHPPAASTGDKAGSARPVLGGRKSSMERNADAEPYAMPTAPVAVGIVGRPSTPLDFPLAAFLDRWVSFILVAAALAILYLQTNPADPPEKRWIVPVRASVILAIYAGVVYPLTRLGVIRGLRRARVGRPPAEWWRTFAVFIVPMAVGCMMWLAGGHVTGLIFGWAVGLAASFGLFWLLFRLQNIGEVELSFFRAAIIHTLATLLAAAVLLLVNKGIMEAMRHSQTISQYPQSPLGPDLPWPTLTPPTTQPTAVDKFAPISP